MSIPGALSEASVWQGLDLEKDVLLDILDKLSTGDKVKLCSVSRSWTNTIESCCNPWQRTTVTEQQAAASCFEDWIVRRRNLVTHLDIQPDGTQESLPIGKHTQRCYLRHMTALQRYQDLSGKAKLSSLNGLPPPVQQLEANVVLPADTWNNVEHLDDIDCVVDLKQLTQLESVKIHATAGMGRSPMLMLVRLADSHVLAKFSVTVMPDTWVTIHWSGGMHRLTHLSLCSICSQAQVDAIVQCINLEELTIGIDSENEARFVLDPVGYDYKIDVCKVKQLHKLQALNLTLVSCYLVGAQYIQCLSSLQTLSVSVVGDRGTEVAVLFRPEGLPDTHVQFGLDKLQHVQLQMHSVFDITDCLEGLQLVGSLLSLHVVLTHSSSRNPSEAHWAIKDGSVLARAVSLLHLKVECTSMLVKCVPPKLSTLHICAKKINVQSHLQVALSQLDSCTLDAKKVEYF